MARIGVFSGTPQRWFQFDEDTEVLIEFINKDRIVALQKKGAKQAKLAGSGADADIITNRLIGEAAVKGWRNSTDYNHPGLLDADNNPIPFNDKNRDMLMKKCREFSNFVNETAIDAKEFLVEEESTAEVDLPEGEELELAKND